MKTEAKFVCGVDEAGRGPLAGAVVAAAVVLGGNKIEGLRDSKKLSEQRRQQLAEIIREESLCYAVALADEKEIDRYNIRQATIFAMQRAITQIVICPDIVLVDGDFTPPCPYPAQAIVGGDDKVEEIMAASILAKTERDAMMLKLHAQYPHYGFASHKGYPTPEHLRALKEKGPCPAHRKTFAPVAAVIQKQ